MFSNYCRIALSPAGVYVVQGKQCLELSVALNLLRESTTGSHNSAFITNNPFKATQHPGSHYCHFL